VSGSYGQSRFRGPGAQIDVADKQVVEKVIIRLTRGGVIVGRVMDEAGEPASALNVQAMQYRYGPNGRTLNAAGSGNWNQTDDQGSFRIYGLEPGQYYLSAKPGQFMGGYNAPTDVVGPATTYFPNSPDPSTAQRVTVAGGRETGPVIITLVSARLSRVRGRAVTSDGQPFVNASVRLTLNEGTGISTSSGATTLADGSFELRSIRPGTYHLSVVPQGREGDDTEMARTTITVNGDDLDGLFLAAGRAGVARGKLVSDDGSPLPATGATVSANPPNPADRISFQGPARVKDDHTFEIKGLYGPQNFRAYLPQAGSGPPWMLKSVMLNGNDIIDRPLDFQTGMTVEGLELVFTQKSAELSGTVTISGDAKLEDTTILLFPADETLWRDTSRFVRIARPDKDGSYRFRMLPAHDDYLLVSALQLEPGQYMDPEFLRSVRERAMRLTIYEGEKKVQNIRIAPVSVP
jgi:hypothetical protein